MKDVFRVAQAASSAAVAAAAVAAAAGAAAIAVAVDAAAQSLSYYLCLSFLLSLLPAVFIRSLFLSLSTPTTALSSIYVLHRDDAINSFI